MRNENSYEAGLYCRLSKDDDRPGESASIETQRQILTDYCRDHGIEARKVYVDDGYSGLNFERPVKTFAAARLARVKYIRTLLVRMFMARPISSLDSSRRIFLSKISRESAST